MTDHSELRVVHALRLKGFADTHVIAESAEVDDDSARAVLEALAEAGKVRYRQGSMTGWTLLPEGRAHGEALLANALDAAGKRGDLEAIYRRFLEHNQPFLGLCTEWQTRQVDGAHVMNDHSDSDYDAKVIGRLDDMHRVMQPICADLGALFPRFESYGPRFTHAIGKVLAGETEWFTKPIIESYHTVWFELHEDLLASLGIERFKEGHA